MGCITLRRKKIQPVEIDKYYNVDKTKLILPFYFNSSLQGTKFEPATTSIDFGIYYNMSLIHVKLPPKLETIIFSSHYDRSLKHVKFPKTLKNLIFKNDYDQSLENVNLPDNVTSIIFGDQYNQQLDKVKFPKKLRSISFGRNFNKSIEMLPDHIEDLSFRKLHMNVIELPKNIKKIRLFDLHDIPKIKDASNGCMIVDKNNVAVDPYSIVV
ncbi:MAG: hypothetical protein Gaeavirus8_7 [Gaeavirus sp.]|uniref:FNIP repeat-containing protein n=1 Tax=Gaeavirus sp. TaxID=2487767 RepID=A0A3G4ZYR8_9VIRU|nr:MAG: hypothetical protein Gaeavirus8_7 [Gaeavirus sp.]